MNPATARSRLRIRPSYRWNKEHGKKRAYSWYVQAWWHAFRLNHGIGCRKSLPGEDREPYPCRWGGQYRDGETALSHWHVGRRQPIRYTAS